MHFWLILPLKKGFYSKAVDYAFRKILGSRTKDLEIHFLIAGSRGLFVNNNYQSIFDGIPAAAMNPAYNNLPKLFRKKMKQYDLKLAMVTTVYMKRQNLITKESMENIIKGYQKWREQSVNDDLESFLQDLRLGKEPDQSARSYFLPMLTEKEMELVKMKDSDFMATLQYPIDIISMFNKKIEIIKKDYLATLKLPSDVDETENKASNSDSKFVDVYCTRKTIIIRNKPWICK